MGDCGFLGDLVTTRIPQVNWTGLARICGVACLDNQVATFLSDA
jgi:hypothetical protein